MNKEEIKKTYSMREIAERYGFQVDRAGFIHCPFHQGDRGASLKIYQDSFHCFGCGANGDIFTFVQMMDQVDFKRLSKVLGEPTRSQHFIRSYPYIGVKRKQISEKKNKISLKKEESLIMY